MFCPYRNHFCYVCGLLVDLKHKHPLIKSNLECYSKRFKVNYIPNLWYVPEVMCDYCYRNLSDGSREIANKICYKYVSPVIWLPRTEHKENDCYFCDTYLRTYGFQNKKRDKVLYALVESVIPARVRFSTYPLVENPTDLSVFPNDPGSDECSTYDAGILYDADVDMAALTDAALMPPAVSNTSPQPSTSYAVEVQGAPLEVGLSFERRKHYRICSESK